MQAEKKIVGLVLQIHVFLVQYNVPALIWIVKVSLKSPLISPCSPSSTMVSSLEVGVILCVALPN